MALTYHGAVTGEASARSMAAWVLLGLLLAVAPAQAQPDCDALSGDEALLPGELLPGAGNRWKAMALPERGDVNKVLSALDADAALVYRVDLNLDGRTELLLTSPDGKLCGNGGCPYELLETKTMKRIGSFFGHGLALLYERVNGYRVIQTWGRYRAGSTSLDTYAFDGRRYKLIAHAIVEDCGLAQWHKRMRLNGRNDR